MTVRELLTRADSAELTEWMAYATIEPFGEERADYRAGLICSTLVNLQRTKGSKKYEPEDFMMFTRRRPSNKSKALSEKLKAAMPRGMKFT